MAVPITPPSARSQPSFRQREEHFKGKIWWSNGVLFTGVHIFALVGVLYLSPLSQLDLRTAVLCFISWQLASFGITIGYHRLWSHRGFTATLPLRMVLAWMGSMGFQGSIKWWVLRHRLHHRFTDSPVHDPYSATLGLWWSHCGWIFRKPVYPRMKLIDRSDLDADPVVRFQHKYFVPLAIFSGLVLPALIAMSWGDGIGGLVWGGAVARLLIWHTTFCINSLAHWTGLQPYTEEVTARGNYLLALLTSGEGNHNFHHAFPKDFRNGPHPADWDPSKWIIHLLHTYTPFVPTLAVTPPSAILKAQARVHQSQSDRLLSSVPTSERVVDKADLPVWTTDEVRRRHGEWVGEGGVRRRRVLLVLEGCVVDVGGYIDEHPGGESILLAHSVSPHVRSPSPSDSGYASGSSLKSSTSALPGSMPVGGRNLPYAESASPPESPDADLDSDPEHVGRRALNDATRAFFGGMNNHSGAARDKMRCLRVARVDSGEDLGAI